MTEARIYVGLHDKDSHVQRFDTEKYKSILKEVCKNYHTPFSLQVIEGGYFHDDGTWVEENTLLVTLIGAPNRKVYAIAKDLCTFFRQESVVITSNPVRSFSIHDDPDFLPQFDDAAPAQPAGDAPSLGE